MPDFLVFVATLPKLWGAKVIIDLHELMPEFFAVKFGASPTSLPARLLRMIERLAARVADRVLVVSPLQESIVSRRIGKPCTVIPNVPDTALFPRLKNAPATDLGETPTVLTHGTLVRAYGIQVLIEALPYVLEERPVRLWIVGEGEYAGALKQLVADRGLDEHVTFFGRVPLEDVRSYVMRADVGAVAFLADGYMEMGLPNKLFEYVAAGRPVIAPDMPGIRSYFDEHAITFFEPGSSRDLASKLVSLLGSPDRRRESVIRALRAFEDLAWDRTRERYLRVVKDLVPPPPPNELASIPEAASGVSVPSR
jgi:glycosyltransferase involved in cell wall biosynthesis